MIALQVAAIVSGCIAASTGMTWGVDFARRRRIARWLKGRSFI